MMRLWIENQPGRNGVLEVEPVIAHEAGEVFQVRAVATNGHSFWRPGQIFEAHLDALGMLICDRPVESHSSEAA